MHNRRRSFFLEFAMSGHTVIGALGLALVLASATGCSSKKTAIYEHENFDDSGTFSRAFAVSEAGSCEAARRALLSQGYIITSSGANQVSGNKSFQQNSENHLQISFNVTCVPDSGDGQRSTVFANALQDRYTLKKSNTSASLGVGVLGSVSMPIGSSDDSMVKVASETVTAPQFYERYFALVESYLPKQAQAKAVDTSPTDQPAAPAADLGLPGAPGAPGASLMPAAPAPATAVDTPPTTGPASGAAPGQDTAVTASDDEPGNPASAQPVAKPAGEPGRIQAAPAAAAQTETQPSVADDQGSQPVAPPAEVAPIQVNRQDAPPAEQAPVF